MAITEQQNDLTSIFAYLEVATVSLRTEREEIHEIWDNCDSDVHISNGDKGA